MDRGAGRFYHVRYAGLYLVRPARIAQFCRTRCRWGFFRDLLGFGFCNTPYGWAGQLP